ncbi:hypothetical protein GGF37_007543, partial [Kickxella alabastrina]
LLASAATAPSNSLDSLDSSKSPPPVRAANQGNIKEILCRINIVRDTQGFDPVFLHGTLSGVAELLHQNYNNNAILSSNFDILYNNMIAPLGSTVSASYQVMYRYTSDDAYINAIVSRIYNKLIISSLDAIGLYYANGIYTIVLANGLSQVPQVIDACPTYATPYVPESIVNGVNLPRILCSINTERVKAGRRPLAVHKALSDEAKEQVKLMDVLGHYFVGEPRKIDEQLKKKAPRISPLYWVAGQGNTDTDTMLDALSSKYYDD